MPRPAQFLLVIALSITLGLHWLLLQSVAWVGMVVNYSQSTTLGEALVKTFDGRHPCSLCKLVREGKANETKRDVVKTTLKVDMALAARPFHLIPPTVLPSAAPASIFSFSWEESPPTPPPRSA